MARQMRISAMVRPDIKMKFQKIADGRGLTESMLAADVIGTWIQQQETAMGMLSSPQIANLIASLVSEETEGMKGKAIAMP